MDLLENAPLHGPRHPWEERRCAFFLRLLREALVGRRDVDALDCGAGDAWFASHVLADLEAVRSVTCWDVNYDAPTLARLGARYPALTLTNQRPTRKFDLIVMLDVLEHVEDDVAFAKNIEGALSPEGVVLVSVPAWQCLFGRHDTFLAHHRRYSPAQCDAVLGSAGFAPVARGGAFHSLLLPRAATVVREKLAERMGAPLPPLDAPPTWTGGKLLTSIVHGMLRLDNATSRTAAEARLNLPGLSYWVLVSRAHDV